MTEKAEKKEFKSMAQVMHYIQTNLKVPKGQTNKFGGYKYRNLEDIKEGLKKILPPESYITEKDDVFYIEGRFYIKATVSFHWGKEFITTTGFAREEENKKGMDGSQVTGAASSYARKYAYNALFGIDDTKDADSMDNSKGAVHKPIEKTGNRAIDKWVGNATMDLQSQTNIDDLALFWGDVQKAAKEKGVTEEQMDLLVMAKDNRKTQLNNGLQ